jgi:hypothetical protein
MHAGNLPRQAAKADQQSPGYSNQGLSKTSQRQQIEDVIARTRDVARIRVAKFVL